MRTMLFLAAFAMFSTTAFADEIPAFHEFKNYSSADMRAVPDVKVKLGKRVKKAGLTNLNETELVLMKNSIYAQVGYTFKAPYLKRYFESRSWYRGGKYERSKLKSIDRENADVISNALSKVRKKNPRNEDGDAYDSYDSYGQEGYEGYGGENN